MENARKALSLSEKDQRSIDVLKALSNSVFFNINGTLVQLHYRDAENNLVPRSETIPLDDFLSAVEYFCANRPTETDIMTSVERHSSVKVYSPSEPQHNLQVVVQIRADLIFPLLESAFSVLNSLRKKSKITDPSFKKL